jgi:hypothetical protein
MPDIFRAGISQAIANALGPLVFDVTLIKASGSSRSGNLTAGETKAEASYTAKGWVDEYMARQIDGTSVRAGDKKIVVLGDTIQDGQIPEVNDQIVAEGQTWRIVTVPARDPAGATYECQVRS